MSGKFSFRLARYSDAMDLATCARDLIENKLTWSWTPPRIARQIRDPNTTVLMGEFGGQFAGFAIMSFAEEHAHLNLLAVLPAFRGRGLGRALLAWLEKTARYADARRIILEVRAGNNAARAFYRKLGFREVAYKFGYYQGRETAVRMCRQLDSDVNKSRVTNQINTLLESLTRQSH